MDEQSFEEIAKRYFTKMSSRCEKGRASRALALILSGEINAKRQQYETTKQECRCPDCMLRNMTCKHIIAVRVIDAVWEEIKSDWLGGNCA